MVRINNSGFQRSGVPAFQRSSVPTFHDRYPRYTMEKTNLQVENQNWEEMKAVLNFSSESSDDELSKSYETMISKIISDESPSPEYQLCYVAESGSDSDENCSLFPEVLNVTSQTIIRSNYKEQSALSNRISCRYPNCQLTFKEVRYMEEHYRRKHSEIRVSCSSCGQSFNHRSGLHRHRKKNCCK